MSETKTNKEIIQCLIGHDVSLQGNMTVTGGVHIDGKIAGDITMAEGHTVHLTLSATGEIDGNVSVNNADINGNITGDLHARGTVTLYPGSRVDGDVYYESLEIKRGAVVNGRLIALLDKGKKSRPGMAGKLDSASKVSQAKSA